jgi:hypothetical protein
VRRLLTFLLINVIVFVSGTSVAAAVCQHRDAQQHVAALHGEDELVAAAAQLEEAAGNVAAAKGMMADTASFSLPAFILPSAAVHPGPSGAPEALSLGRNAAKVASLALPPLLEPPAA